MADVDCRRCSECVGQEHHWIENDRFCDPGDPEYVCKHCESACVAVDDADGLPIPSGIVCAQPPVCGECDEYAHACYCDDEPDAWPDRDRRHDPIGHHYMVDFRGGKREAIVTHYADDPETNGCEIEWLFPDLTPDQHDALGLSEAEEEAISGYLASMEHLREDAE
jgi:hypothetical protein